METIDIAMIVVSTVIVLVMCGSCVTKGRIYNRQRALHKFNAVLPLQVEAEYQTRIQRENVDNPTETEETQRTYPTIVISCLHL